MDDNTMKQPADRSGASDAGVQGRPYRLRRLQAKDISPMARIIGKIGIDELISCYGDDDFTELMVKLKNRKKMVSSQTGGGRQEGNVVRMETVGAGLGEKDNSEFIVGVAVATRIANKVILNLDRCEKDIYGLLGSLSGKTAEEIAELELETFIQMIVDVFRENNVVNFIRAATKLLK